MKQSRLILLLSLALTAPSAVSAQISNKNSVIDKTIGHFDPASGLEIKSFNLTLKPQSKQRIDSLAITKAILEETMKSKGTRVVTTTFSSNMPISSPKHSSKILIADMNNGRYFYNMPVKKIETDKQ